MPSNALGFETLILKRFLRQTCEHRQEELSRNVGILHEVLNVFVRSLESLYEVLNATENQRGNVDRYQRQYAQKPSLAFTAKSIFCMNNTFL